MIIDGVVVVVGLGGGNDLLVTICWFGSAWFVLLTEVRARWNVQSGYAMEDPNASTSMVRLIKSSINNNAIMKTNRGKKQEKGEEKR